MENFDHAKWQYVNGLEFSGKNGDWLQIAYKWSTNEIIYVNHTSFMWIVLTSW
jgi:hypothetical protein